jgi:hypothetical protein
LWPATGLLGLLAVVVAPRPAGMALVVFATAFILNSFAGPKNLRYLAYGYPFLFVLWGIGLAALWGGVRRLFDELRLGIGPALGLTAPWARHIGLALAAVATLFLVLANSAWLRTATLLADIAVPPEEPYVHWREAADALSPWVRKVSVVVTTSELETLYHLGRYDILLSRSRLGELPASQQHEFGRDWRTGRPIIAQAQSMALLLDCSPSGLVLTTAYQWSQTFHADAVTKQLVEKRAHPLALPAHSQILAWTWEQPAGWTAPTACVSLPALPTTPSGPG